MINDLPPEFARRRVLRMSDAAAYCGLSVRTFKRLRERGALPEPLSVSGHRLGWRLGDLVDLLDCRETGREWKDCKGAKAA